MVREAKPPFHSLEDIVLRLANSGDTHIKSLKLATGEEIVAIIISRGRRKTILAVPMKIVYDDVGAVHLVPWMTAAVQVGLSGSFVWSDQPFELSSNFIIADCWPLEVVRNEYLKRLNDPQTWLNNASKDIDSFSLPDDVKIQ